MRLVLEARVLPEWRLGYGGDPVDFFQGAPRRNRGDPSKSGGFWGSILRSLAAPGRGMVYHSAKHLMSAAHSLCKSILPTVAKSPIATILCD